MPVWLLVLLVAAVTWRATRLVVADDFPPVRWARRRLVAGGPEWLGDLVSCAWCASVWLAAGVVAATDAWVSVPRPWLVFGGAAAAAPLLQAAADRLEHEPAKPADEDRPDATRYRPGGRISGGPR